MSGNRIAVLGAGAWGTALAVQLNRAGAEVILWTRSEGHATAMDDTRINQRYLPDIFLEPTIAITSDLAKAAESDALVLAVPSQAMRPLCITLSDMIDVTVPLIVAAKGIERGSLLLMSEVIEATLPSNPVVILSGPNFAKEAAQGLPTATVLASRHANLLNRMQFMFSGRSFRPYTTDDIISVQVGGALKNVIALACGITLGAGLGENARAAVMTRGLSEMTRLAEHKGGKARTMQGLAGLGDLSLSCCSAQSRNMALGLKIGEASLYPTGDKAITPNGLAEGVLTAEAVYELSLKLGIPMPISVMVADILKGRVTVQQGVENLLTRPLSEE